MKDFTYYYNNKINLDSDAFYWLSSIGLKETQWILDAKWLSIDHHTSYKEWIRE